MDFIILAQDVAFTSATIKVVVGALAAAIVFMTGGFIYIFRKTEAEVESLKEANTTANGLIQKYMTAYIKLETRYKELKRDYEDLKGQRSELD